MRGVGVDDLAPVRIQVGLGDHRRRGGADLDGLPEEPHLRCGELLAGVADEEHRVGLGQQAQDGRQVRLALPADARGVDERQPAGEQRAGYVHLHAQHRAAGRPRIAAKIAPQITDRDVDALRTAAAVGDDDPCCRFGTVRHHRHDHGALVVTHSGDRHVQQRIEQLALALFELSGDHHPDGGIGDPVPGSRQPGRDVGPVVEFGDGTGVTDQLDDHRNLTPILRLAHLS